MGEPNISEFKGVAPLIFFHLKEKKRIRKYGGYLKWHEKFEFDEELFSKSKRACYLIQISQAMVHN